MSDEYETPEAPVFGRDRAPEHGPAFWATIEERLTQAGPARPVGDDVEPGSVVVLADQARPEPDRQMRRWPLLVAAAAIVLVGLGALVTRSLDSGDDAIADVASGAVENGGPAAAVVPLEGPGDAQEPAEAEAPVPQTTPTPGAASIVVLPTPEPPRQDFERALGNDDKVVYVPLAGELPNDARFLATWEERRLSWFSVAGPEGDCGDLRHSQIYYVNEARIAVPVNDPQLHFSGEIDYFTVEPGGVRAAWLVSCGTQLEFYVATFAGSNDVARSDLVWTGRGVASNALILWDGQQVSLNALSVGGSPFFVDYNLSSGNVSGDGLLAPALDEPGQPDERWSAPLGASADARFTYWNGNDSDDGGGCSDQSSALWVRDQATPGQPATWVQAVVGEPDLEIVTAFALEDELSQVAFATGCHGREGQVFIGQQRADGRIDHVAAIDLAPYVPGFADQLHWIDETTLRIETNNPTLEVNRVRFDYHVTDGVIVLLN